MIDRRHTSNHKDVFAGIVERLRLAELQAYTTDELISELKRRDIKVKVIVNGTEDSKGSLTIQRVRD